MSTEPDRPLSPLTNSLTDSLTDEEPIKKEGPTFPRRTAPSAAVCHMLAHETATPKVEPIAAELHRILIPAPHGGMHPEVQYNPSIYEANGSLRVVVRMHHGLHGKRPTNCVARVTKDWTIVDARGLPVRVPAGRIEDVRMFMWNGRPWAICATHDGGTPITSVRQALLELNHTGTEIERVHVQPSARHEKNWMPCVDGEELHLVYSVDPLIVMTLDHKKVAFPSAMSIRPTTGHIRGGSQLVPWQGGWLAVVHQVHKPALTTSGGHNPLLGFWPTYNPRVGPPVVYLHRFAFFNRELTTVKLGGLFNFKILGIEFCAGLTRWQGGFVAAFGVSDEEAWLAEITEETVAATFDEVEDSLG